MGVITGKRYYKVGPIAAPLSCYSVTIVHSPSPTPCYLAKEITFGYTQTIIASRSCESSKRAAAYQSVNSAHIRAAALPLPSPALFVSRKF